MVHRKINRRAFVRKGVLFVPTLLLARKSLGQFASQADQAFMAQGASKNGLLNNLVSYYKFDNSSTTTTPDAFGSNDLSLNASAQTGVVSGVINTALNIGAGSSYAESSSSDFNVTGGSFVFSYWQFSSNWSAGAGAACGLSVNKYDNGSQISYACIVISNLLLPTIYNASGTGIQLNFGLPSNNVWHHTVWGWDQPNNTMYGYFDNGAKISTALSAVHASTFNFRIGGTFFNSLPSFGIDECAFYKNRTLNATDVANLYNGGAGLPFSKFTT